MPLSHEVIETLKAVSTATTHHRPAQEGPAQRLAARHRRCRRPAADRRPGLHAALRAGPRGPGDAGLMGVADLDAGGDRGDAGRLRRGGRCDGRHRRGRSSATSCAPACRSEASPALVTDGVIRDIAGVLGTDLPVWCNGVAAPPSVAGLTFVAWQEPIGCGGVAVFPDDVIVVDHDGAVLIPAALLDAVLAKRQNRSAWRRGSWTRSRRACRCPASIR